MSTAQAIRRHGIRKWYERELLRGHANLVLLLLASIGLLASAEVYQRSQPLLDQLQVLGGAAACVAIGIVALRSYLYRLNHAEYVADQANCKACSTYGRLDVQGDADTDGDGATSLRVRCRHCGHHWDLRL